MIKFFRKIRQGLLTESKFGKYLLYAVGEIVLVVLGILIALSLNTWNDQRKDRIAEKELYKTLIESLEIDLEDVRLKRRKIDSAIIGQELFITHSLEEVKARISDEEFFDLLQRVGNTSNSFVPNLSVYNKIVQNREIDLIQSIDLQQDIIDLYEVQYWEYKDLDNSLERAAQEELVRNFFGDIAHWFINNTPEIHSEDFIDQYKLLSKECRKIYFVSTAVKTSMINCEAHLEYILPRLREELDQ